MRPGDIPKVEVREVRDPRGTVERPQRAILFTVGGTLLLTSNDALAKALTGVWPVSQIMAIRGGIVVLTILAAMSLTRNFEPLRIRNPVLMAARAGAIAAATILFLGALQRMPIADTLAIVFISPILVTIMAVLFLGEKVGWRRWSAVGCGFLGVLVILDPGGLMAAATGDAEGPGTPRWVMLLPMGAALFAAVRDVVGRRLVSGDHSLGIIFYGMATVALLGSVLSLQGDWVVPAAGEIGFAALAAGFMFSAHFLQVEGYRFADIALIAPFRYCSLLFAGLLGWVFWGEVPGPSVFLGAGIIVASGLFIWWREARLARKPSPLAAQP